MKKKISYISFFIIFIFTIIQVNAIDEWGSSTAIETVINNEETLSYIKRLIYTGLIQGDENGDLQLEKTLTRAEAAVIFSKLWGYTEENSEVYEVFSDVPSDHWASSYVWYAHHYKIINGISEENFAPDDVLNFNQLVTLIVRSLNYGAKAETMGGYPIGYLLVAEQEKIVDFYVDKEKPVTRALVFQLIDKSLNMPLLITNYGFGATWTWNQYLWDKMQFTRINADSILYNEGEKTLTVTYSSYEIGSDFTKTEETIETFICELEYDYKSFENLKPKYDAPPIRIWVFEDNTSLSEENLENQKKVAFITGNIDYPLS